MRKKDKSLIPANILTGYLFLMFCIYPFYFENGYYNIGIAKNNFFCVVSIITVIVMVIATGVYFYDLKKRGRSFIDMKDISITQKMLLAYMAVVILSFLFSSYKDIVLWGADGWYMGTIPLLIMGVTVLFLTHLWKEQKWVLYGGIIVSGIVFFLGICNRFSFYPVPIEPPYPTFISTLGNINWFCGYMSVLAPIGVSLFVLKENKEYKRPWIKWILALYVYITFIAGFCQGSSSVFLWNAALFAVLFCIAVKNTARIRNWLLVIGLWGAGGQTVRLLIYLLPDYYSYDTALLVDTNITLLIALAAIVAHVLCKVFIKEEKELPVKLRKGLRICVAAAVIAGVLLWIGISVYNTNVGIPSLENSELFMLDGNWGNKRGASLKTAFMLFGEMSIVQKLFGVGADGFSVFAYSFPEIQEYLTEFFGESILTNSHCEVVTNLVNLGILGVVLYVSLLLSFIYRAMKNGEKQPLLYVFAVCVICYMANNLISFAQILNIPFMFFILGMGEYYLKQENKR